MIFRRIRTSQISSPRRKNGLRLATIGVFLGILLGIGKVFIERSVEDLLFTLLNDEAQKACACSFEAEEVDFSLLTMRGTAINAKIVEEGIDRISVPKITADFNLLKKITQKRIALTSLKLFSPLVNSVHPDSGGVRFISSLARPLTPEQKEEFKIRIKLLSLDVIEGEVTQPLPFGSLIGQGVSLQFLRDNQDNLRLTPSARNLIFRGRNNGVISFGNIESALYITDDQVSIETLLLTLKKSFLQISGIIDKKNGDLLSITGDTEIFTENLALSLLPQGHLSGSGKLNGSIDEPTGSFELSSQETGHPLTVVVGNSKLSPTTVQVKGALETSEDGGAKFSITPMEFSSPTASLIAKDAITLENGSLFGTVRFRFDTIQTSNFVLHGGDAKLLFKGKEPLHLDAHLAAFEVHELRSPKLHIDAKISDESLDFSIQHASSDNGRLQITGNVEAYTTNPILTELGLDIAELRITPAPKTKRWGQLTLSGRGSFAGPLDDYEQLSGAASLALSGAVFRGESALNGKLQLTSGVATAQMESSNGSISVQFEAPISTDSPAKIALRLVDFQPKDYFPELQCLLADLDADYSFSFRDPFRGSGTLQLSKLTVGCNPYQTALVHPQLIRIEQGQIMLPSITFRSADSDIDIAGTASIDALDLSATGSILLKTFLPLTPFLDDLSGRLELAVKANGNPTDLQLSGTAAIKDGAFAAESLDILGTGFQGDLLLTSDGIKIDSIFGELNSGRTVIRGNIDQKHILDSNIIVEFEDIVFQPSLDIYGGISGELLFTHSETGKPFLTGEVNIENGEIIQEFDIRDIISRVPQTLLGRSSSGEAPPRTAFPDIDIDITMNSDGSLFVITSYFGIEATGNVQVRGNLNQPLLRGNIATKRGWLGFNEVRFDIVSGAIEFKPPAIIPSLSVIGETYVRGARGENTLIVLETKGSLLRPQITLISDDGLSQREILALLGTRSDFRVSSGSFSETGSLELPSDSHSSRKKSLLGRLIQRVTRIDALSFQPKFNARRGQLEPALVAEKKVFDDLDLVAESFLSQPQEGSQLFLRYQLTPKIQAIGTLDTVTSQSQASVGADLSYTVLSKRAKLTRFDFAGVTHFKAQTLLDGQRLSENALILRKDLPRIERGFKESYEREGFFDPHFQLECIGESDICKTINVMAEEGPRSKILSLNTLNEPLPQHIQNSLRKQLSHNVFATKAFREILEQQIITHLRSEGFLQAKCDVSYDTTAQLLPDRVLTVALSRGEPITINFVGNSRFSSRELLETINLFKRKHPFGANTIRILARNIEKRYREEGYLYATVGIREILNQKDNRKTYTFSIREESQVSVSSVAINGLKEITKDEILRELQRQFTKRAKRELLAPQTAVSEEILEQCRLLTQTLNLLGFPDAQVRGEIIPDIEQASVQIHYTISENERLFAQHLQIAEWPKNVSIPIPPESPYSIPKANIYIEQLLTALQESGYLYAALWTEFRDEQLIIHVEKGPREKVRSVQILGTTHIPESIIRKDLTLVAGAYWTQENQEKTRDSLLQKGLFSRVTVKREPISAGISDISVTVLERPLQSLEIGMGANSVFGLHFFGEAIERELFLDGRNLSLRFDTFYDDTSGELSRGLAGLKYSNPHFGRFRLNHTEDIRYEKLDLATQEFDLDRISFSSSLAYTQEELSLSLTHTIFSEDLSDVTPDAILDRELDTGHVRLSFLSLNAALDRRDNPLTPRSGYNLGTELRFSANAIGSEANYLSLLTRASWLHPIEFNNLQFGFASALRMGIATPFAGTDIIPISQRYYLGGRTTIRGFRENSLGPTGEFGAVIGGDLLFASNNEVRYFPSDTVSLHTFFDFGSVYLQDEPIHSEDLRLSAGVGLRYISPIGPIGFDLGFPLDEQRGEPSSRIHFAIGSNF